MAAASLVVNDDLPCQKNPQYFYQMKNKKKQNNSINIVDFETDSFKSKPRHMKSYLAVASLFALSTSFSAAQFIDFENNNVKVVFNQQTVDGNVVTVATATVTETSDTGIVTVRRQTEKIVPSATGTGTEKIVTEEETLAIPNAAAPGTFIVTATTTTKTTPIDEDGNEGETAEDSVVDVDTSVAEADLDLPQSTEFVQIDPELDTPIVISAE